MYTIFGKSSEKFYIELSAESTAETYLPTFKVESVTLVEEFGVLSPMVNVRFVDPSGFTLYYEPLLPTYTYVLKIGPSIDELSVLNLRISNVKYDTASSTDVKNVAVSIDFFIENWHDIYVKKHSRSFNEKRIDQVVSFLSREIGYRNSDIEFTNRSESFIQPYWTNARFLSWLQKQAQTQDRSFGYVMYVDRDAKLTFASYKKLYQQQVAAKLVHFSMRRGVDEKNLFNLPQIKMNYVPTLRSVGFGVQHMAFDYEHKQFIRKEVTPKVPDNTNLSTHTMIGVDDLTTEAINYSGRDIRTNATENLVRYTTNNTQYLEISIDGRNDLMIGNIVEILMPVSHDDLTDENYNHIYSGKWLITKIVHQISAQNTAYTMTLRLSRAGINLSALYDDGSLLSAS